jgi:phosphatidylglycerophosphate synthase
VETNGSSNWPSGSSGGRVLDDLLRGVKDRLLAPAARAIGPRCPPLLITFLALAAGLAAVWLAASGAYAEALAAWLANRVLDGLDGALARTHGRTSDLGGYLDLLCDFVVYAGLPIGLAMSTPSVEAWRALALLLAAFYVNAASWLYLSALLERRGRVAAIAGPVTSIVMPPGLIAGTETIIFYGLFLLWPTMLVPLSLAMGALVLVGITQRVIWAARVL